MRGAGVSDAQFLRRAAMLLGLLGLAWLAWSLRGLLILVFGAVLLAVILRALVEPARDRLHLKDGAALALAVAVVAGTLLGALWLFGAEVAAQASSLGEAIPAAWQAVEGRLDRRGIGQALREQFEELSSGGIFQHLGGVALSFGSGLADALLVIVGGIYIAGNPELYRRGIIKLAPPRSRGLVATALDDSGRALRLWLLGQLASMVVVGVLTTVGLLLLGVPSALVLGLLAALLEFVPFIGPIAAAVPALVLALAVDPELALWVAALYLVVQQLEGNVIQPIVQQHAVELPPAILVFSLVAAGLMFGIVGIIFAAPLTVVAFVLVKRLYIREALSTRTTIPGEADP
jgi:predicted PurR-regulated permease PerM